MHQIDGAWYVMSENIIFPIYYQNNTGNNGKLSL
jgi:hypothetical protein